MYIIPKTYHRMKLLDVEGLKLRYPDAEFHLREDGTLSSMWNNKRRGPSTVTVTADDIPPEAKTK